MPSKTNTEILFQTLQSVIEQGFIDNKNQHDKITKCLFGNGEIGIVGKVSQCEINIIELHKNLSDFSEKLDRIGEFNAKISAQISLWKWLVSFLGAGNIIGIIYFLAK